METPGQISLKKKMGLMGLFSGFQLSEIPSMNILKIPVRCFRGAPCSNIPLAVTADKEYAAPTPKEFWEIPGPKPWPIFKNTFQIYMSKDFDTAQLNRMWAGLFKQYGPIMKVSLLGHPDMVLTQNPDDVQHYLKMTMNNPIRNAPASLKHVRDNAPGNYFNKKTGVLPENGEEWWRLRSRFQGPLLRPRNVAMYLPKVDKATVTFMDRIDFLQKEDGQVPDDFLGELHKWTLECIGLVALDRELGCLEQGLSEDSEQIRMLRTLHELFAALNETELGPPTWKFYRSAAYVKMEKAHSAFLEIADKSIQEAARKLEETVARGDPNRTLTIMETFLNTDGLSKSDVATMILDMIFAGVDTTAHTLAFALYLLAKNPECQQKLQMEVDEVLGDANDLQPYHLSQMTYLTYVLKEVTRLYPVSLGISRVMTDDIVLSGYKVPGGTAVMCFLMNIGRSEDNFQRPNDFLPERWNRDRPYGAIHPFASLPFSYGTRMCIGKRIAEQEIYTFLIRVLQKYDFTFESPLEMEVKTELALKPDIPLPFKFHTRK